jgi:hypothetical protein
MNLGSQILEPLKNALTSPIAVIQKDLRSYKKLKRPQNKRLE